MSTINHQRLSFRVFTQFYWAQWDDGTGVGLSKVRQDFFDLGNLKSQ